MSSAVMFFLADDTYAGFLPDLDQRLEHELMTSLLFEDSLLIPDRFLFANPAIIRRLRDPTSLLSRGFSMGVIQPVFRDTRVDTFIDAYEYTRRSSHGFKHRPDLRDVAIALDSYARMSPHFDPRSNNGDSLCQKFDDLVGTYLLGERASADALRASAGVPASISVVDEFAQRHKEVILRARRLTHESGSPGLRHSLLATAIQASYPGNPRATTYGEYLSSIASEPDLPAIRSFLWRVGELHRYARAEQVGAMSAFGVITAVESRLDTTESPEGESNLVPQVTANVQFPLTRLLATLDPQKLLAVRNDWQPIYLDALAAWRRESTPGTEQALLSALDAYAERIRRFAANEYTTQHPVLTIDFFRRKEAIPLLATQLFGLGSNLVAEGANVPSSLLSGIALVATGGYVAYRWAWTHRTRRPRPLRIRYPSLHHNPSSAEETDPILLRALYERPVPGLAGAEGRAG